MFWIWWTTVVVSVTLGPGVKGSYLVQGVVLGEPSQAGLQRHQLGLLADDLHVELVALLLQLSDLLAVPVLVDQTLGEVVLRVVPSAKRLSRGPRRGVTNRTTEAGSAKA